MFLCGCCRYNLFTIILLILFKYNAGESSSTAAVRANYPIPPQCGLFYFEITVVDKGNGYVVHNRRRSHSSCRSLSNISRYIIFTAPEFNSIISLII